MCDLHGAGAFPTDTESDSGVGKRTVSAAEESVIKAHHGAGWYIQPEDELRPDLRSFPSGCWPMLWLYAGWL